MKTELYLQLTCCSNIGATFPGVCISPANGVVAEKTAPEVPVPGTVGWVGLPYPSSNNINDAVLRPSGSSAGDAGSMRGEEAGKGETTGIVGSKSCELLKPAVVAD